MRIVDNVNDSLGDDLKAEMKPGSRLRIAASTFSIYAFEALRKELEQIEELRFIFTSPTFMNESATDQLPKARREFFIPRASNAEATLYGSEFEIRLRNKMTQRAIARECAAWVRTKVRFRSNTTGAPMQQFAVVDDQAAYLPLQGFTSVTPTGRPSKWPGLRLSFLPQQLDRAYRSGALNTVLSRGPDGLLAFIEVDAVDADAGTIDLVWNGAAQERGIVPGSVVIHEWVGPSTKRTALTLLANQVIEPASLGAPNPVTIALLRGDPPAFVDGRGPAGGLFGAEVDELASLVVDLDRTVLAVQGPPGTGKTYRGAHMAKALVAAGKRVGIMAMSHAAIDNFLAEIVDVFACGRVVELRAARYRDEPPGGGLPGVKYVKSTKALISPDYDVVAGTAWQFASEDLRSSPVDVLLIDEAGQLALVDAVVGSMAARSLVLLGDPQQLPQVAQAVHPRQSGASALGYLLVDDDAMPPERGVFIEETRRMHPDVCRFISDRIYGGRLSSHPACALQKTDLGTGLRWLRAEHSGCSTESVEEAELVAAQLADLMGRRWTDKEGVSRSIGIDDVMVVAPYNDQVRLLRDRLNADSATRGIPVGTVDKFQGRQASVVFFTMTSSSAADMPRGTEFLFSKNRLNVAVSRAQCLAYLVCTEELLKSRAKTVDDMLLIATLCAFVEYATA